MSDVSISAKVKVPRSYDGLHDSVRQSMDKPYFENLDTLRFLSFFVVFLFHVQFYEWIAGYTSNTVLLALARVASAGGWGVTFFFALSGFLITWLMLVEKEKHGNVNIRLFYMRRVLRIWPLYYLVFFIGVVVLPILYNAVNQKFYFDYNPWLYGTFLSNYGVLSLDKAFDSIRSYSLVMNISWSVSIEEQFYLVWPLLYALNRKYIGYISPLFIVLSCIAAWFLRSDSQQISINTLTCIGQLAVGGLLAYITYYKVFMSRFINALRRWSIGLIYLGAFATVYASFLPGITPLAEHALHLAGATFFGLIIIEQNFSSHSFFKFGRFKLLGSLGRISYGLYMLHPLGMFAASFVLQKVMHSSKPVASGSLFMLVSFVITVLVALVSYRFMEQPLLRLKKKFDNKK